LRAWALKRMPEGERWDIEAINGVKGTPAEPVPGQGKKRVPIKVRIEVENKDGIDERMGKDFVPRRARITRKFYEKFGYTEGCEGCGRMKAGLDQRPHEERCRKRMEEAMEADEEGRNVLEAAKQRGDEYVAEGLERHLRKEEEQGKGGGKEAVDEEEQKQQPEEKEEDQPKEARGGGKGGGPGDEEDEEAGTRKEEKKKWREEEGKRQEAWRRQEEEEAKRRKAEEAKQEEDVQKRRQREEEEEEKAGQVGGRSFDGSYEQDYGGGYRYKRRRGKGLGGEEEARRREVGHRGG
jgi:hypothetical protein